MRQKSHGGQEVWSFKRQQGQESRAATHQARQEQGTPLGSAIEEAAASAGGEERRGAAGLAADLRGGQERGHGHSDVGKPLLVLGFYLQQLQIYKCCKNENSAKNILTLFIQIYLL